MRWTFTLFITLLLTSFVEAEAYRGFLHTKDDIRLTGYINFIQYRSNGLVIQFTNDFGDEYIIEPNRVAGFGFATDGEGVLRYVSRFHRGQWLFLRVVESGRRLDLLRVPDNNRNWVDGTSYRYNGDPLPMFWLEGRNQFIMPVYRGGFRRTMRELLADAPQVAEKIGSRGYRYRNLPDIIKEYNQRARRASRQL